MLISVNVDLKSKQHTTKQVWQGRSCNNLLVISGYRLVFAAASLERKKVKMTRNAQEKGIHSTFPIIISWISVQPPLFYKTHLLSKEHLGSTLPTMQYSLERIFVEKWFVENDWKVNESMRKWQLKFNYWKQQQDLNRNPDQTKVIAGLYISFLFDMCFFSKII